ncbi:uncharacterized protein FA14DRAFT_185879 [Meira miltonrushii]|uniref:Protein-S-isoprenylcysteine O-methyltransferase n=1 Tax=Meira miltonrushii TaxID=1280837 RepID=A0A316V4G5_9BASI|nr:uncharacterized protein FA14DRAFT_185879 [Meira miltonrushii]PWN31908.1 hypothetical protein FA14DRAFT_185879 [Meira miltonrushii]
MTYDGASTLLVILYAMTSCFAGIAVYHGESDPSKTRNKLIAIPNASSSTPNYDGDIVFRNSIYSRLIKVKFFLTKHCALLSGIGQGFYIIYRHYSGLPISSVSEKAFAFNLFAILSGAMRIWCYQTLKKSFTFGLKVSEDQKLITTGPYRYLAHPSYTAMLISAWTLAGALMGPYNAFLDGLSTRPFVNSTFLKVIGLDNLHSVFLTVNLTISAYVIVVFTSLLLLFRIPNEEAMMKAHFGKRYDDFLSERWRLIPFIY